MIDWGDYVFQLGLVSVSFREKSPSEIIKAAKAADLNCIEWGSDVHAPCNDPQRLIQIKEVCDQNGILCCSYGTYFRIGQTPTEEIYDYIRAAKLLGTNILRIWAGNKNSGEYTEDEKQTFFSECAVLANIAEKENVVLCLECHNNTFTDCLSGWKALFSKVDSHHFKTYWQPNQFKSFGENLEYARAVAPQTTVIHAFHWRGMEKLPLIEAKQEWQAYLNSFHNIPVLLEFMPDNRIESLVAEAEALREITRSAL